MNKVISKGVILLAIILLSGCSEDSTDISNQDNEISDKKESEQILNTRKETDVQQNDGKEIIVDGSFNEKLSELRAAEKAAKCYTSKDGIISNTYYYISLREGIFIEDLEYGSRTLSTDVVRYSWLDNSNQGMKTSVQDKQTKVKVMISAIERSQEESIDDIKWMCKEWKFDKKKFEIPSNIQFVQM